MCCTLNVEADDGGGTSGAGAGEEEEAGGLTDLGNKPGSMR